MIDMEKAINCLTDIENIMIARRDICPLEEFQYWIELQEGVADALSLLKEQEELLKHEYWRGYNNGRADERGLQEGTIMQTFSPD